MDRDGYTGPTEAEKRLYFDDSLVFSQQKSGECWDPKDPSKSNEMGYYVGKVELFEMRLLSHIYMK